MDSEQIKDLIKITAAVLPLIIALINKLTDIVETSANLSDDDKAELLVIVEEMQSKVNSLELLI
jgi:hypothetical protein